MGEAKQVVSLVDFQRRQAITLLRRGGSAMNAVADLVEKAAACACNVLVTGESGTGKGLVARAIHERSARASAPFVVLDVGSIPDAAVESLLFGHEAGAFPGAERAREGLFRAASGGTLFLDEIGHLPLAVQPKVLRAVETKEILPVGADRPVVVDTRIVAATHCDLAAMVEARTFREDLFYRLQVMQIHVPALRERPGDIASLAADLLTMHARTHKKPLPALSGEAIAGLLGQRWPGNVRELSNVLERAVVLDDVRLAASACARASTCAARIACGGPLDDADPDLERATLAFQRRHVARVLDAASGNREVAAKRLGLSPATFYRYLQKLGLKGYRVDEVRHA